MQLLAELPWAGLPVLPVSIADVNYLSCKMAFRWHIQACPMAIRQEPRQYELF